MVGTHHKINRPRTAGSKTAKMIGARYPEEEAPEWVVLVDVACAADVVVACAAEEVVVVTTASVVAAAAVELAPPVELAVAVFLLALALLVAGSPPIGTNSTPFNRTSVELCLEISFPGRPAGQFAYLAV